MTQEQDTPENRKVTTSYDFLTRVSYFNCITPKILKNVNEATNEVVVTKQYGTQLLIPKEDTVTVNRIKKIITDIATEKWGSDIPKGVKITFRDGDKEGKGGAPDSVEAGDPPYGGHYFINVHTSDEKRPIFIGQNGEPIPHDVEIPADMIVSGDYVVARIKFYAWPKGGPGKFGTGISAQLISLQFAKKGEPLGGDGETGTPGFKAIGGGEETPDKEGIGTDPLGLMD